MKAAPRLTKPPVQQSGGKSLKENDVTDAVRRNRIDNVGRSKPASATSSTTPRTRSDAKNNAKNNVDVFDDVTSPMDAPFRSGTQKTSTEGRTLALHNIHPKAPTTIPIPEGVSPAIEHAATHLWNKYAHEPKVADYLEFEMEQQLFDPIVDAVVDDYRMGLLMSSVPLADDPIAQPFPKLEVTTLVVETATEHKVDNPLDHIREALKSAPATDIFMAPEWLFVPEGRFHSQKEMQGIVKELLAISKTTKAMMVPGTIAWVDDSGAYHNTALAIEDGKILKQYDKRNDGDDEDFAKKHGATYARGDQSSLFEWKGRTVALEVCRDHGDARARWDMEYTGASTVDLQLVVSAGVDLKHAGVGMGGIALVANGDKDAGEGPVFWGGRRVPLEDGDHPLFVRTAHDEPKVTALKSGGAARTMTV